MLEVKNFEKGTYPRKINDYWQRCYEKCEVANFDVGVIKPTRNGLRAARQHGISVEGVLPNGCLCNVGPDNVLYLYSEDAPIGIETLTMEVINAAVRKAADDLNEVWMA